METIRSTYRLQFNHDFDFRQCTGVIAYLYDLGVNTLYASPILAAVPGSQHGYDGIDAHQINSEIGDLEQLIALKKELRCFDMKWLQDIVPNHMAYHPENIWLADLLKHGKASVYNDYFDTIYACKFFGTGKLMLPILGQNIDEALQAGELMITHEKQQLWLCYFEHRLPLSPASYTYILDEQYIAAAVFSPDSIAYDRWLHERLVDINQDKDKLRAILDEQHYQLCLWTATDGRINYRRFFTVNGLICLNVQEDHVFEDTHRFILELLERKIIDGLRIDHIDGLYNPTKYLRDLRRRCGSETYIVAEKILEHTEILPSDWPIQGTTGYDFLALCNNVCTDSNGKAPLTRFYQKHIADNTSIEKQQVEKKRMILARHMQGEVDNLHRLFLDIVINSGKIPEDVDGTREVIELFLAHFPVYRLYEEKFPFGSSAFNTLIQVFDAMMADEPHLARSIDTVRRVFERAQREPDSEYRQKAGIFFQRLMQFTGPVMAKGVEDTLMYTYNRFIAHNEVGDHPGQFGISVFEFHDAMQERQKLWPAALNTTATHDTKRGEDVRSRLQIWSAWPEEWIRQVGMWEEIVEQHATAPLPHPNDRYFIYQALFGSYPMPGTPDDDFCDRFVHYLTKYLREGKVRSDWSKPNKAYEQEIHCFAKFLLAKDGLFYPSFYTCFTRVVDFGIYNSLTQVLLKFTCPGVPDLYQGTELWDLSFVDPDNRRSVCYETRRRYLKEIKDMPDATLSRSLWEERYNGKIKLWLIMTVLHLSKKYIALSPKGDYIPLVVEGKYRRNILAYARKYEDQYVVTVVALHLPAIEALRDISFTEMDWEDTAVVLPTQTPVAWQHLLCPCEGEGNALQVAHIFQELPVALIHYTQPPNPRSAGILMHITSLPSPWGIGDLGTVAYDFARFLHKSGQRWWQVLPLGPTSTAQNYSPYSTRSAMAGNPLLIDVEALLQEGLLKPDEIKGQIPFASSAVDFLNVEKTKMRLLHLAFLRADVKTNPEFENFCMEQAYWLEDYVDFTVLHHVYSDTPWYNWPRYLRTRHPRALAAFRMEHEKELREEKWIQYIFFKQWAKLKAYCNSLHIKILGDVPMYVGHDSADVWAHPELFSLTGDGGLRSVAGVPPDYFNAEGQLWGMPTYRWDMHCRNRFQWWIRRLTHNNMLFDKVRLDHFRAFAAYWEVPATADTAKNGQWVSGPGEEFFNAVRSVLGELPFVVEDLGDINEAVYKLRDAFQLPGTKVLQFAFGEDMSSSPHIPHCHIPNAFVYTGTHDNNTVLGWFRDELDEAGKKRLTAYSSVDVDETNIGDLMIKMAYASVADTVIVPLQDVLSLPAEHRMNNPAQSAGSWRWIVPPDAFDERFQKKLRRYTQLYGRAI